MLYFVAHLNLELASHLPTPDFLSCKRGGLRVSHNASKVET